MAAKLADTDRVSGKGHTRRRLGRNLRQGTAQKSDGHTQQHRQHHPQNPPHSTNTQLPPPPRVTDPAARKASSPSSRAAYTHSTKTSLF